MIIVEGPDGSGKTTLIEQLVNHLQLPIHKRACNSDGSPTLTGPRSVLYDWSYQDVRTLDQQVISIYDRHPLISEYVYGPIIRHELPDHFETVQARGLIHELARYSLVIICRPSLRTLISSVTAEKQMDGVTEHITAIRASYDALSVFWPVRVVIHNWEDPLSVANTMARARLHVANENKKRNFIKP